MPELVTSPHTTLHVDTPPLVAVTVQPRLSQSSGPAESAPVIVSVAPVTAPLAAKLAAVAAPEAQHAHRDQHLRLLGRSLLDEELGGLEQAADLQQQRGLRQRSGAAAAGQSEREGLPRAGRWAHQCELIMINDEALVQTKSLSTQIAGNTGNVVCNTSFTNLSKTEMAKVDVAELQQLFDGTKMITLDYSHLTWGARKSFQGRLDKVEAWPKNP